MLCEGVLNLVRPLYAQDISNHIGSRQQYFEFYGYISSIKRSSSNDEWKNFYDKLYFRIATSCKRLEKESVPDMYTITMTDPHQYAALASLRSHGSSRPGHSSDSPESSPWPQMCTELARPSAAVEVPSHIRQISSPDTHRIVSQNQVNVSEYTSKLKEHVDINGGNLRYDCDAVSSDHSTKRCVVTLDNHRAEGTGSTKKLAKHAASKALCKFLGISRC
jgi:hypothetical protein